MSEKISQGLLASQERVERSLALGRTELKDGLIQTTQALEGRFKTLEGQVTLRLDAIGKSVETKLSENLKEGFKHFEKVQQHLAAAEMKLAALSDVGRSISDLNNLLKLPHLRGGFGEATLERILADFLPVGSYETQYAITPGSTERVDAIVRLGRQVLPIDVNFRVSGLPLATDARPSWRRPALSYRRSFAVRPNLSPKNTSSPSTVPRTGLSSSCPAKHFISRSSGTCGCLRTLAAQKFSVSPNTLIISLKAVTVAQDYYELSRGVEPSRTFKSA